MIVGSNDSEMKPTLVCISREKESSPIPGMPFYDYVEGWKPFGHEKTRERVAYLADRRNKAVSEALDLFPQTKDILMIDSYYLQQGKQIRMLIDEYARMADYATKSGLILGASTWIHDETRIRPNTHFYDGWTTPEAVKLRLTDVEKSGGVIGVKGVGGCYLYPRWVWEKIGYGVPEDLHGCEHNWLCERSRLPIFLTLNVRFWRQPIVYQWPKRIRVSLHLGRFLGRHPNSFRRTVTRNSRIWR